MAGVDGDLGHFVGVLSGVEGKSKLLLHFEPSRQGSFQIGKLTVTSSFFGTLQVLSFQQSGSSHSFASGVWRAEVTRAD